MLSDARIAEIAAVEAAATPGPWDVIAHSAGHPQLLTVADAHSPICDVVRSYPYNHQADADFIADARQAVPELLADRAELVARVAELEAALEPLAYDMDDRDSYGEPLPDREWAAPAGATCGEVRQARALLVQIERRGRGVPAPYPIDDAE